MLPVLLWFALAAAQAQDWPQLLGPSRNGVYSGASASLWTGAAPSQVWKKAAGPGFSPPVVSRGRLILFHRLKDRETVEAMDSATGKPVWTYAYPTSYRDDFGFDEGPRAAPVVDGAQVFTFGAEGQLHCVDFETGRKLWSVETHRRFNVTKGFFGAACSPVADQKRVMVGVGGPNGAGIVAFDRATGAVLWQATSDEASYSSPVLATLDGVPQAVFLTRAALVTVETETGKVRARFPWRSRSQASVNAATPLVIGNQIFVSASYSTGAALIEISGSNVKKLWSSDDALSNHYASSVFQDGYLYGYHGRQEEGPFLRAVELRTGKVAWTEEGFRAGTVLLAGNRLVLMRENGELVVAQASPRAFQVTARARLLDGTVRAYPALAAGVLYLRNENTLAAYRIFR